ncbi:DUF6882 domain-containing protein [Corynebacterium halotolerans]|uniref:Uncharacterized protein n=1 Tax=Corynebacterium halotolerans YIM 70093 = DSM 44683 TaxID=1121362 RepID=M1P5J1_9CORY|nr:DUF6882 domain-containing protein [Corynebacterium halotolerans]AGF71921.1 hypothetical protein A605_04560 [Corynebacterium halotolerans YIM 70093 = DSM 44683]
MELPHPSSLADVITDGMIAQADIDAAVRASFGPVTGVEFTGPAPTAPGPEADSGELDAPVEVRLHGRTGDPVPVQGVRLAVIRDGVWTWATTRTEGFSIPELREPQPASDDLVRAARTLFGNVPVLLAPHDDTVISVIAVTDPPPSGPLRSALISGLSALDERFGTRRALMGFAAFRGLGYWEDGETVTVADTSESVALTLRDGRVTDIAGGMRLDDVRADALYYSAEHQLLLDGLFPGTRVTVDLSRATAEVTSDSPRHDDALHARAQVIATVTGGTWTWAWADPNLTGSPAVQLIGGLERFGLDHGIPALFRPHLPAEEAHRLGLTDVAKPVTGLWTHAEVPLNPETTGIVLLDAEALRLPPPTAQALTATLHAPADPSLDLRRAVGAYAGYRGVSLVHATDGAVIPLPTAGERVTLTFGPSGVTAEMGRAD